MTFEEIKMTFEKCFGIHCKRQRDSIWEMHFLEQRWNGKLFQFRQILNSGKSAR